MRVDMVVRESRPEGQGQRTKDLGPYDRNHTYVGDRPFAWKNRTLIAIQVREAKTSGTLKPLTGRQNSRRVVRSLSGCGMYRYRQATGPETKA
jgi:hypothetical protein